MKPCGVLRLQRVHHVARHVTENRLHPNRAQIQHRHCRNQHESSAASIRCPVRADQAPKAFPENSIETIGGGSIIILIFIHGLVFIHLELVKCSAFIEVV